jgi:hypothetical protein
MFKRLYYELTQTMRAMKNNDLLKWLAYQLFRQKDDLFRFICAKHKLVANLDNARCVEKAALCMLEDAQLNEQVCFAEMLCAFYDLQPESVQITCHD